MAGFVKFLLGCLLACALLISGGSLAFRYVVAKLTEPPPRPTFPNDKPSPKPAKSQIAEASSEKPKPVAAPPPTPKPLEAGAYRARVTQPIGLILRDNPSRDGARVGGLDYNARVIVLGNSSDGEWQRIRLGESGREGWVKAGNTEKVNP